MIIQGTSVTVKYRKIGGIKKAYFVNEEDLKSFFNEATILPVPDDAPLDIPRIIAKTKNEHGTLNISPVATTFEVHYNDGYERDWKKCAEYLKLRMVKVFDFLNQLTGNDYEYIGLISTVVIDEITEHCVERLSNTLLNAKNLNYLYDINIRYTFVEDQDKFVNITLQNARMYSDVDSNEAGALSPQNQKGESVGAIIDINDRYAFNNDTKYKSNSDVLNELIISMSNIIDVKLNLLVTKGEY